MNQMRPPQESNDLLHRFEQLLGIGVLQLINAKHPATGEVVADIFEALTAKGPSVQRKAKRWPTR